MVGARLDFSDVIKTMGKVVKEVAAQKMGLAVTELHSQLLDNTPVWSGEAVANWKVSQGTPDLSGPVPGAAGFSEDVGPGQGGEFNRPQSESIALQTLSNIDFKNPFKDYFIANNAPHIGLLDAGALPNSRLAGEGPGAIVFTAMRATEKALK
jgi:hypothetical protein